MAVADYELAAALVLRRGGEPVELLLDVDFTSSTPLGIKVGGAPLDHFGMALVIGMGHGFEILGIARRPADIFERTAACGRKQARIVIWGSRGTRFKLDCVAPVVAKIVKRI